MGRKPGKNDDRWVVLLKSLVEQNAPLPERGRVLRKALADGCGLRALARALGLHHKALQKWLAAVDDDDDDGLAVEVAEDVKVALVVEGNLEKVVAETGRSVSTLRRWRKRLLEGKPAILKRGRPKTPPELPQEAIDEILRFVTDPATHHLSQSARKVWHHLRLKGFDVSEWKVRRFLREWLPEGIRLHERQHLKSLRSTHKTFVIPGKVMLIDRSKSDLAVVVDEIKGIWKRFEIAAFIDQGSMLCWGVTYCERDEGGNPFFDTATFNAAFLRAITGEWTGVKAIPDRIVCDFGKVENNKSFLIACAMLGIEVQNTRPYSPESKPEVEAFFAFLHDQLEKWLPGYLGSDHRNPPVSWEGKAYRRIDSTTGEIYWVDSAGRRLLTVRELNERLREWVWQWNRSFSPKLSQFYSRTVTRLEAWLEGVNRVEFDERLLAAQLLPFEVRVIGKEGTVRLNNRQYYSPLLVAFAFMHPNFTVEVRYDPSDPSKVFLFDTETHKPLWGDLEDCVAEEEKLLVEGTTEALWWTERKRAVHRRVRQAFRDGKRMALQPQMLLEKLIAEAIDAWENFPSIREFQQLHPEPVAPQPTEAPKEPETESGELSWEEQLEILKAFADMQEEQQRRIMERQMNAQREGWAFWLEIADKGGMDDAPIDDRPSEL